MEIKILDLIEYIESARETAEWLIEQGKTQEASDIIQLISIVKSKKIKFE